MASCLFDLLIVVEPVAPDTIGSVVYDRFEADPTLPSIAVVDADERPIGLIERNAFSLKMAGQYGRALYAGRPVELIMDRDPRIVDGAVSVQAFTDDVLLEYTASGVRGFILTDDGRYRGVGSALSILQAQNADIRLHAMEAQAALRAKTEFLAVMSHEIRTPLNGVLALADVIASRLVQDDLRPYVDTIVRSGQTLLRLLNDALDLSRAEAGRLQLEDDPFRVGDLSADVNALWRSRATEVGLELVMTFEGGDEVWALGDAVRLKQVLNNFVGNALKFTQTGTVDVRLKAELQGLHVKLNAEVRDTGPGISPTDLERLFKPFSQTENGRRAGGAGLGLSICRQLIERMGGWVRAESELGRGSVFSFEVLLPRTTAPELRVSPGVIDTPLSEAAPHILIVDDNAANRMVAEALCGLFNCTCESVENGALAVDRARNGYFDLILMDIQMPIMGGLDAVRHIRALPSPIAGVPIVALTANADPSDAEAYLAQGMDAVVEKPIKVDVLMGVMTDLLTQTPSRVAA